MTLVQIETLVRLLTKTDSNSFTAAQLLILENNAYERLIGNIIAETMGASWEFGDSNYSALPTATTNLTNSTAEYQLFGSAFTSLLNVLSVEILNVDGVYFPIRQITLEDIHRLRLGHSEFNKTDGLPQWYELREDFIILYPAPDNGVNVTLTAGLKVFFQRSASLFVTNNQSDNPAKSPGFLSPWHDILAYDAAYQYAIANSLPNVNLFRGELDRKNKELLDFVSRRNQDKRKIMNDRNTRLGFRSGRNVRDFI